MRNPIPSLWLKAGLVAICLFGTIVAALAEEPPRWLIGTFSGYNGVTEQDVEVVVRETGWAQIEYRPRGRGSDFTETGRYAGGNLRFRTKTYRVDRRGSGVRLTNVRESRDYMDLARGSGGESPNPGGGGGAVPSWAVGSFFGYNGITDEDVTLRIDRNGSAVRTGVSRRTGRQSTESGRYRNGEIAFRGRTVSVRQVSGGIRLRDLNDDRNYEDLKSGSGGGRPDDGDAVPSWAVGSFFGYNGITDEDVTLRIDRNGSVVRTGVSRRTGRQSTESGRYRDGEIAFRGRTVSVRQVSGGIRLRDLNNDRNYEDLTPGSGGGRPEVGGNVPSWGQGEFSGWDGYTRENWRLEVERDGRVRRETWPKEGRRRTTWGIWRGDRIQFGRETYFVERRGDGIRLVNLEERRDWLDLRRD